ncbi:putative bifunctional diguanylate cyclase/phosphodiesterase [Altererythrobacter xiamenensis]|uniref:putative bifunctional diguanylate cyclase/phosphodiesterase n=1 Tax=Altererythrobacter xiamenensis TaxID=1316679 RepID=UPI0011788E96|nr:EAL domain-containing protein [Altererythrobacter xiamenensis]
MERIATRERMRENTETVRLLLNDFESQAADWLWRLDDENCVREPTARFAEAVGQEPGELHGTPFLLLFAPSPERDHLESHIAAGTSFRELTLRLAREGEQRWWKLTGRVTRKGGMRGVASDVTAQKSAEERVHYMAHYDELTDLANRFLFHDDLQRELKRHSATGELAILCLDLDSFKSVNETLGHPAGDALLIEVAKRIQSTVRQQDLVARLGGDEFAVLMRGKNVEKDAERIARRILAAIVEPVLTHGTQIITSTSIGIALAGENARDADALMRRADLALYAAKGAGRNRFALFEPGMDQIARERRELEMDLRSALVRGQFELYYQPLIKIETGQTAGYEALIRWHHPERGTVCPDDFVPLAEETGLIVQMGEWVIRQACAEVAAWPEHLRVSVNLSPAQMRSASLVGTILNAIAVSGIDPSRLELEITENVLLHDSEANLATLHKLRELGVRIALDDFGTGYSSLNYLRSFPFDKIKIDKCFVGDLETNPDCLAIVRAVTALASSMGMETTAEGVELADQLELLRAEGCTQAQGYLFSRPEKAELFTDLRPARPAAKANLPGSVHELKERLPEPPASGEDEIARRQRIA